MKPHLLLFLSLLLCPFTRAQFTLVPVDFFESSYCSYFGNTPDERITLLDSTFQKKGSPSLTSFVSADIKHLLGDTTNIERLYTFSGVAWTITNYDAHAISKITKRWHRFVRRNKYDLVRVLVKPFMYDTGLTYRDSVDSFFDQYISLPVLSRIDFLDSNLDQLTIARVYIISKDLNAITGCVIYPFGPVNRQFTVKREWFALCRKGWLNKLGVKE